MLQSMEYQRYKQKLDRLQNKVKKSESARKELQIRLQSLMRERDQCEKSYDTLLVHERKRINRNHELLHMLEEVHSKAEAMALNTERLRKIKDQQERIILSNWRRSAHWQQLMQPSILFAADYLPAIPAPHRSIDYMAADDESRPSEMSAYLSEVQEPVSPKLCETKSMRGVGVEQMPHREPHYVPCMMPVYQHNHPDIATLNESFHLPNTQYPMGFFESPRFHPQMMASGQSLFVNTQLTDMKELRNTNHPRTDRIAYYSHFNESPYTNLISERPNHYKYLSSIPSNGNYATIITPHKSSLAEAVSREPSNSFHQSPSHPQSNKPPSNHNQSRSFDAPFIHYANANNQLSFGEEPDRHHSKDTFATNADCMPNAPLPDFASYEQQMRNKLNDSSNYSVNARPVHTDQIKQSDAIPFAANTEKTSQMSIYSDATELLKNADSVHNSSLYESELQPNNTFPRVESINCRKASISAVATTATATPSTPTQKDIENISQMNNIAATAFNELQPSDYRRDERAADFADYRKDDFSRIETVKTNDYPNIINEKSIESGGKRRSSIDSSSLVKSAESDSELPNNADKMNLRRRYSVAANLLDFEKKSVEALQNSYSPSIAYLEEAKTYRRDSNGNEYVETNSNVASDNAGGVMEANAVATDAISYEPTSMMNTSNSQSPVGVMYDHDFDGTDNISNGVLNENDNIHGYYDEQQAYPVYATNNQTHIENAMENLHLEDAHDMHTEIESKQFDNKIDKISKTVTWADDLNNDYTRADAAELYEPVSEPADTQSSDNLAISQLQQNDYLLQAENVYQDNESDALVDQYPNQMEAQANHGLYNNEDYYYANDQVNQYEQYEPQHPQEDGQQLQYYSNEMDANAGDPNNSSTQNYQQYQVDSTLPAQPEYDDYYTVSPGEKYYEETEPTDTQYGYEASHDTSHDTSYAAPTTAPPEQYSVQPQPNLHVPNYLQSDSDNSQTGYQTNPSNKAPSQDSDFDFSTNSETH